jgi:hypothetical protein
MGLEGDIRLVKVSDCGNIFSFNFAVVFNFDVFQFPL